jgi:hypothetical protein
MMIRYYSGLGVGHVYAHRSPAFDRSSSESRQEHPLDVPNMEHQKDRDGGAPDDIDVVESDVEMRSIHSLDLSEAEDQCSDWEDRLDNEELDAMDEMYGSAYFLS